MNKPLSEKDKVEDRRDDDPAQASGKTVAKDTAASPENPKKDASQDIATASIGAYAPSVTQAPDLSQKAWDNSKHAWSDTTKGRIAIRTFSRGIMGAAFFTAGGMLTRKWMHSDAGTRYMASTPLFEQKNPLRFIAKLVDLTAGNTIKHSVALVAGEEWGERAVLFRPSKYGVRAPNTIRGRSLGDEVVHVTFDFFCASVGDAWGRDIAGWFDPNAKKSWMKDGKLDVPDAIKSSLKSVARYVTYNGGEDWAVAIPYVYFMGASRKVINKFSPGFEFDPNRNVSGGSHKMDDSGKVVSNYNLEGMLDLQGRFTVYNMGTLMYREAYNYIGDKLAGRPAALYGGIPEPGYKQKKQGIGDSIGTLIKWTARSVIKGAIYMTPAVPFFWITRTPQSKRKGIFIHPEKGMLGFETTHKVEDLRDKSMAGKPKYEALEANRIRDGLGELSDKTFYYTRLSNDPVGPGERRSGAFIQSNYGPAENFGVLQKPFNPYAQTHNIVDAGFNLVGKANNKLSGAANKWAEAHNNDGWAQVAKRRLGMRHLNSFSQNFVDASVSYTPYMIAKAEFANVFDTGKTDLAAERLIDGVSNLNWGEFKSGLKEVGQAVLHKDFDDPKREAEAQRRIATDETLSDAAFRRSSSILDEGKDSQPVSWLNRVVQGKKPEEKKAEAAAEKAEQSKVPASHAEKEAMRKALDDLTPPTNSIH